MQNREQNATTGMQGTVLSGGALQLFQWDSGKHVEAPVSCPAPSVIPPTAGTSTNGHGGLSLSEIVTQ